MRLRLPLVLATIAALLGAPSLTSAASNDLAAPSVSPTSGSVTTVFTLLVSYDGKFPVSTVSVAVAGLSLPMARVSGTLAEGTWAVNTLLPAGTWTPTFSSSGERGSTSVVTGPTIAVTGGILPGVTPAPTGTSDPSSRDNESDGGPVGTQDPGTVDPGTAPAEGDPVAEPSAATEPTATSPADASPGSSPGGGTLPPPGGSSDTPRAPGTTGDAGADDDGPAAAPAEAPAPDESRQPAVMPASDESAGGEPAEAFVEDWTLTVVLLLGLSGVAAVAVIGTALLILGRRRSTEDDVPIVVPERTDTDAVLQRRTVRRARVRLEDDPIVTAMGVDDQMAARRQRRRASQGTSGPNERPTRPQR